MSGDLMKRARELLEEAQRQTVFNSSADDHLLVRGALVFDITPALLDRVEELEREVKRLRVEAWPHNCPPGTACCGKCRACVRDADDSRERKMIAGYEGSMFHLRADLARLRSENAALMAAKEEACDIAMGETLDETYSPAEVKRTLARIDELRLVGKEGK